MWTEGTYYLTPLMILMPTSGPVQVHGPLMLLSLRHFRGGPTTVLERVPETPGIYAWYPTIELSGDEPIAPQIERLITSPHCVTRSTNLAPNYRLDLHPYTALPKRKADVLADELEEHPDLVDALLVATAHAILFQGPLYIGKATSLRNRIGQHLADRSKLRRRFAASDIDIERCRLLCLVLSDSAESHAPGDVSDDELDEDDDESLEPRMATELLLEDILSRLFHPSHTKRYG